jgi:hypothetical protein
VGTRILLRCVFCNERWFVNSDGSEITDIVVAGVRCDWANHTTEHIIGGGHGKVDSGGWGKGLGGIFSGFGK